MKRILIILIALQSTIVPLLAQSLSEKYNKERPVVVVCDWDKPPYEFLDGHGVPAGSPLLLRNS